MSKKVSIGALVTLMAIVAALTFSMTVVYYQSVFNDKMSNLSSREAMYRKLSEVDKLFRTNFVGQIDDARLNDFLSSGYAWGSGDPYARYLTKEEYQKTSQASQGRIVGIGVITEKDASGYLKIKEVYPNSPAASSNLEVDDLIVSIDELEVKADNAEQMQALLEGEAGTKMTLLVRRGTEDFTIADITRRYVDIPSVFSRVLEGGIGYIRITAISDTTDEQFSKQLEKLIEQKAQSFIVDLRGTADGVMDSAIHMLDRMLPADMVLTATRRDGTTEQVFTTDSKELTMPVVILTNDKTAREAEVIAQVMKDFGRARTVGTKTMGKGTKQEIEQLEDGSAIQLSTAIYKTPNSETFDKVGVKPDYEVLLSAEEEKNFANLDEFTDPQMKKAIEVIQGLLRAQEGSSTQPDASSDTSAASDAEAMASASVEEGEESSSEASAADDSTASAEDASSDADTSDASSAADEAE